MAVVEAENNARVFRPLDSSVIDEMEYNLTTNRLTIKFNSGSVWQYEDIPEGVWRMLTQSESIGRTFNTLVRGEYTGYKLNILSQYV